MAEKRYNPWFKDMSNKMNTPKESFFFRFAQEYDKHPYFEGVWHSHSVA